MAKARPKTWPHAYRVTYINIHIYTCIHQDKHYPRTLQIRSAPGKQPSQDENHELADKGSYRHIAALAALQP